MSSALVSSYEALVCDLDGVVYRGSEAVPHAVDSLNAARHEGTGIAYATNNASRPPGVVYEHLAELGIDLAVEDVMTSAVAGAERLADLLPQGSTVLAVGGEGVAHALESVGLRAVRTADLTAEPASDGMPVAVLQGFGRDVAWTDLEEAGYRIRGGARWVATNTDLTVPVGDRGNGPGNGTLVAAVRQAVDVDPEVVGKPFPALYLRCAERLGVGPEQTLAIGDRLDTDIAGAARAGMDSLFVLTGVTGARGLVEAQGEQRPTFLGRDLRALHEPYLRAVVETDDLGAEATCGPARVRITDQAIELGDGGSASERLRAFVAAATHRVDEGHTLPAWPDVDTWILEGDS
ncbi:HAD-IIA family hydrolase [Mobilicoccus massiliensis]|uniref:HAD-IIA family hydrolase n=1 Tax=Mobilicoccus massiliensis TaxID=1522310 RepID=UPI00058B6CB0|nr:HAD-IIA family hydrolase [Mobilicoccus massiliensis]